MSLDREAGARLRAYMEPRMGSVLSWSEKYGIGRDTIYALWRGRMPRPATMAVIASALGVTYEELMDARAGKEKPPTAEAVGGELSAAIRDLTSELRAAREERSVVWRRLDEVEAVLDGLVSQATTGGASLAPRK